MQRILSSALASHAGQRITIAGWIHRRRWLKSVAFLIVRDRAGLAQVVVTDAATRTRLEQFGEETAVRVTGLVTVNPAAPGGAELTDPAIMPLCDPVTELPVELHRPALAASLPTLLDHADITLRHPARQAVFRLSAALVRGFRSTLDQAGYTEIFTPKIVGSATESGANVFELDYFGRPAYLAQSPQFYKQTMVGVFERVYEVGPAFRAEPSDTARHLAEFTSLDVELGFIDSHRDVMAVLRDVLAGMMAGAGGLGFELPDVPREIPIVHFTEALAIAGADPEEPDLAPADERALGEWARREHGSDFLFVEGYPTAKRAFYTHPEPCPAGIDRGEYADHICRARCAPYSRGFDLLFRGVELVSGAQRLHRYRDYVAAITERGDAMEPYRDFLSVFAHGMPPHGGFAIGLERLVARLVGAANIREVTLFPRDLHRVSP